MRMRVGTLSRGSRLTAVVLCAALTVVVWPRVVASGRPAASLPDRLSDAEFWALATDLSEPGGYFRITDNFTSNEIEVGQVMTALGQRGVTGGAYLGVGPEQNFSYIAAIRPSMAFVLDIRRQAAMQHLMFKALFELAADRADFISLLFARPRPDGLHGETPIQQMWQTYFGVAMDTARAADTARRVLAQLTVTHGFRLTDEERGQLASVLSSFVQFGPTITTRGWSGGGGNSVTFADLTGWALDASGVPQSFLSSEAHFQTVKALHTRNLIVPVTGDFGGPKALRAIGAYLRANEATVSAYYLSNVEQYLFQDGKARAFYDNVAALPLTDQTVFIRPYALRRFGAPPLCPVGRFLASVTAGRVLSNNDATACASGG